MTLAWSLPGLAGLSRGLSLSETCVAAGGNTTYPLSPLKSTPALARTLNLVIHHQRIPTEGRAAENQLGSLPAVLRRAVARHGQRDRRRGDGQRQDRRTGPGGVRGVERDRERPGGRGFANDGTVRIDGQPRRQTVRAEARRAVRGRDRIVERQADDRRLVEKRT